MSHDRPDIARPTQPVTSRPDVPVVCRTCPSAELIQYTIRVWEPRLHRKLTEEDARQILENVVGFFRVLHEWELKERRAREDDTPPSPDVVPGIDY